MHKKKVILVGLDSLQSDFAERFIEEGRMPNLKTVKEQGFYANVLPTQPPITPTGWATIATGAWPGTHGIFDFFLHKWGEPFERVHNGCMSTECKAEFLWNAAARQGRNSIVIKYPTSFPFSVKKGIQIDGSAGFGGQRCTYGLTESICFANDKTVKDACPVKFERFSSWKALPTHLIPLAESKITIPMRDKPEQSLCFHLLTFRSKDGLGIALAYKRDMNKVACKIGVGEWSNWIIFKCFIRGEKVEGSIRFKLLKMSQDLKEFHLFATSAHRTTGYSRPKEVSFEIYEKIGPFPEYTHIERYGNRVDDQTQLDLYRMNMEFIRDVACYLMKNKEWDLLMLQWHPLDYVKHIYYGAIDPEHPDYDSTKAQYYWDIIGKVYEMADELIRAIRETTKENATIFITGDHGHDLTHTSVLINQYLRDEGFLSVTRQNGKTVIDASKTLAYAGPGLFHGIYINLRGREEGGIVEPGQEHKRLCQEIIGKLQDLKDPRNGRHVICNAWYGKDIEALGYSGFNVPDIIFTTCRGYECIMTSFYDERLWGAPVSVRQPVGPTLSNNGKIFIPRALFNTHTSSHECFLFTQRAMTVPLYIIGPGIRKESKKHPVNMVNIASTIAKALAIDPPKNCEGYPIDEAFT